MLAPVVYLTPQFTRMVRFPRGYVEDNQNWTAYMKRTIFDDTLKCMARRPEINNANWGLILRLNAANALMCRAWFSEVTGVDFDTGVDMFMGTLSLVNMYVK